MRTELSRFDFFSYLVHKNKNNIQHFVCEEKEAESGVTDRDIDFTKKDRDS